eukprot:TRINITY_DN104838_c0_g1_i1.p1 TRINITY_DN104838_c0_g1~~TRINITY_DN104838_c0_g1_i1.p1  ORF type:complete len:585 (+),score=59.57 TRINITY_DN104838_c0_g1_i1:35-1756(+)
MDEFSSAYVYGLRTPSPRRASAATSPDLGQADSEAVRQLFPQELPQLPGYLQPPQRFPSAACSSSPQSANSAHDANRAPLKQLESYQYSDRLIPSRAASNLESGLGLLDVENSQYELANSNSSQPSQMAVTITTPRGSARDEPQHRNENGAAFERLLRNQLLGLASPQPRKVTGCERSEEDFLQTPERGSSLFRYKCQSEDDPGPLSSSPLRTVSTCSATPPRLARKVPTAPYKVLHAPKLEDDFYLNLLDFSSEDVLAVGIGNCVDLWNARVGRASRLCNLGETKIASVRWTKGHFHRSSDLLAVGTGDGQVQIWDVVASRKLHTLAGHSWRACALAWADDSSLFTGAQDRNILRWDLRQAVSTDGFVANPAQRLRSHTEEVCALSWSQEWQQLSSGGNEGKVLVWSGRSPFPELHLGEHVAAVKALAWSPCHRGMLATGGGTADKSIRIWNTLTGAQGTVVDTESQVCNLAWSPAGDGELLSTHGYSTNQLALWRYQPGGGLSQTHSLKWHKSRVLYLTVSSDGQTVVTGDGNETLCFWNILARCKARVSTPGSSSSLSISEASSLSRTIR